MPGSSNDRPTLELNGRPSARAERRRWCFAGAALAAAALVTLNGFGTRIERRLSEIARPVGKLPTTAVLVRRYEDSLLVSTRDNRVCLVSDSQIVRQESFQASVGVICPDPQRNRVLLGDNLGHVYLADPQLTITKTLKFPGRITGLAVLDDGGLAVCYGLSAYGPDYYVTFLGKDLDREQDRSEPGIEDLATDFCTTLLATDGKNAIYATANARLGMVAPDGRRLWRQTLMQRPLSIAVAAGADTAIAVADRRGRLTAIDKNGKELWSHNVSRFPLKQVTFSSDREMILSSDSRGRVFVHNRQGQLIYGEGESIRRSGVVAFADDGKDVLAFFGEGDIRRIGLAAASDLRWAPTFRTLRSLGNVVLIVTLLVLVIAASVRLSRWASVFFGRLYAGRLAYVLLIPTFALLCLFNYYPVITAFAYSFTNYSLNNPVEFTGLDNFRQMLGDRYVWIGAKNICIFLFTGLIKTLTVPLLVAELVFWLSSERLKQFLRSAFIIPAVVPGLVFILLWAQIYHPDTGLLNKLLTAVGLKYLTTAWLAREGLALWSIVCAGFPWINIFAFLILMGGLINIDRSIYEAAEIDGVNVWRRFWKIDVPLIKPQIKLLIVFTFIGSVQNFMNVLIFTDGGPKHSTYVPALYMFKQISGGGNLGYAASIGLVLFAIALVATVLNLKFIKTND